MTVSERMVKGVIFDMDGLLIDSERPICDAWISVAQNNGYPFTKQIYGEMIGRTSVDTKQVLTNHFGPTFPYVELRTKVHEVVKARTSVEGFKLKQGALKLLKELKELSVPVALATSTGRQEAIRRLKSTNIDSYFTSIACGDEVKKGKPEPDIFLLAADRLFLKPRNCLVLEDSIYGARGAHKAGMKVIVIPDLATPPEDVLDFAHAILPNLEDANKFVRNWLES